MDVRLTNAECRQAAYVGINRRLDAMKRESTEVYGSAHNGDYWTVDVEAAAAELAAAKALGRYWSPADDPSEDREGDLGDGLQVRHTKRANGCLICHQRDADEHRFFLVVGSMPAFRVVGHILGRDAKKPEWWRTDVHRPAFFVPQYALTAL